LGPCDGVNNTAYRYEIFFGIDLFFSGYGTLMDEASRFVSFKGACRWDCCGGSVDCARSIIVVGVSNVVVEHRCILQDPIWIGCNEYGIIRAIAPRF
jgi:hypothetical protein